MSSLSLVAAMNFERVIGKNNQLPWHVKSDLINFKKLTVKKPVIMGRKTFESLGKPLPNRPNIVITRDLGFKPDNVFVFNSIDDAISFAKYEVLPPDLPAKEVMIIGGEQIFDMTLEKADNIYLTIIEQMVQGGDAYFPEFEASNDWEIVSERVLSSGLNGDEPKATFQHYSRIHI